MFLYRSKYCKNEKNSQSTDKWRGSIFSRCYFRKLRVSVDRDPLKINVDILPDDIQEQAKLEIIKFGCWRFLIELFSCIHTSCYGHWKVSTVFNHIYLCKSVFSTTYLKWKYRARLDVDSNLPCALLQLQPDFQKPCQGQTWYYIVNYFL